MLVSNVEVVAVFVEQAAGPESWLPMLFVLVFGLAVGTLIAAIIFRAACWLHNKLARLANSPVLVPEPGFGRAIGVVLAAAFLHLVVSLPIAFTLPAELSPVIQHLIFQPIGLLTMAVATTAILPTGFGKGILIALLCWVVLILSAVGVVVGIALVVAVIMLILWLAGFQFR